MSPPAPSLPVPTRAAWEAAVWETAGHPGLRNRLARPASDLLLRFGETYARLGALPRAQRRRLQRRLGVGLAGVALLLALGLAPAPALAGGVVGTGTPESCTDAALDTALSDGGSVTFDCGAAAHTITVGSTKTINTDTTIDGGGLITLNGDNALQVITVNNSVTLTLKNATISGGSATYGGGIYNKYGTLTVLNSTLSGNSADWGGGIDNSIGGFSNPSGGTLTVQNSTLSGNTASTGGGGIYNFRGTVTVRNSTLSGNSAGSTGGGIKSGGGALAVVAVEYSTLSGNSAGSDIGGTGGGIWSHGTLTVQNSTLSGNSAKSLGGGIYLWSSGATVRNSIVALQVTGADCGTGSGGSITSQGYNIESGTNCGFTSTGDQRNVTSDSLKLGSLTSNGGPTQTQALLSGSVAIDQIATGINGCVAGTSTDQRGAARASNGVPPGSGDHRGGSACDIGAYEYDSSQKPNAVTLRGLAAAGWSPGGGLAALGAALALGLGGLAFWKRQSAGTWSQASGIREQGPGEHVIPAKAGIQFGNLESSAPPGRLPPQA